MIVGFYVKLSVWVIDGISVFSKSSSVTVVPLALFILPPLLTPAFNESETSIISPHLKVTPASIVVVNAMVSPEFCSLNKNHFPNL